MVSEIPIKHYTLYNKQYKLSREIYAYASHLLSTQALLNINA